MNQDIKGVPQPSPVQTNSASSIPKFPLMKVVVTAVLLGILGAGGYFLYTFLQSPISTQKPTTGVITSPATQQDSTNPRYIGSQTMALNDLTEGLASGTASRNVTQDKFFFSVNVSLPEPFEGQFYQVWVKNGGESVFPIGKLSQNQDGSFSLEANFEISPSDNTTFSVLYNTLIVTFETVDDDSMEVSMLEGNFAQ